MDYHYNTYSYEQVRQLVDKVQTYFGTIIPDHRLFIDFNEFKRFTLNYYISITNSPEISYDLTLSNKFDICDRWLAEGDSINGMCATLTFDNKLIFPHSIVIYINPNSNGLDELYHTIVHEFCHIKYPHLRDGLEFDKKVDEEYTKINSQ